MVEIFQSKFIVIDNINSLTISVVADGKLDVWRSGIYDMCFNS